MFQTTFEHVRKPLTCLVLENHGNEAVLQSSIEQDGDTEHCIVVGALIDSMHSGTECRNGCYVTWKVEKDVVDYRSSSIAGSTSTLIKISHFKIKFYCSSFYSICSG